MIQQPAPRSAWSKMRTEGMVMHYTVLGYGCQRIAKIYKVTRQAVYDRLKSAGVTFRPLHQKLLPKIEWNGASYTFSHSKRYYRRTDGERTMLHHDVWLFHYGPIPPGHVIYHRDADRTNNDHANLVAMTLEEMGHLLNPLQQLPVKLCLFCGAELERKRYGDGDSQRWESPSGFKRRTYCNGKCAKRHAAGKPRGWSPNKTMEVA